jgi:hypothetical protein
MSVVLRHGFIHSLNGATFVPFSPRRKDTGHPCRLPDGVVDGVLMSACAST